MKLLIVVLCLAVGPRFSVRCMGLEDYLDDTIYRTGDRNQYVFRGDDVLGSGAFGIVFHGVDVLAGREVAVKVEAAKMESPLLPCESEAYDLIGPRHGIPTKYYYGTMENTRFGKLYVLVMKILGKSLAQLEEDNGGKFSPKTVYMIGIQLMYRIEIIHKSGLVHRDIKPGNLGVGKGGQLIYIFDFGLAQRYKTIENSHIPEGPEEDYGSGTPHYMSAYAHSHDTQSRRDDMESIGIMLMSFLRGNLPWDDDSYTLPARKSPMVKKKKELDFDVFCKGFAKQMVEYFDYVRNKLEFSTRPNYQYLRQLFRAALKDINEEEDYVFDWSTKM